MTESESGTHSGSVSDADLEQLTELVARARRASRREIYREPDDHDGPQANSTEVREYTFGNGSTVRVEGYASEPRELSELGSRIETLQCR